MFVQRTKPRATRGRPPLRADLDPGVTLIKKYGNRRLYDTRRSRYVTLEDVLEVVATGEEIKVVDAKSGEDLTKMVMTKIIFLEEERRHLDILPLGFLKKLLQHRDDSLREFYQKYLSLSLEVFMSRQQQIGRQMEMLLPAPDLPVSTEIEELKARILSLEARVPAAVKPAGDD